MAEFTIGDVVKVQNITYTISKLQIWSASFHLAGIVLFATFLLLDGIFFTVGIIMVLVLCGSLYHLFNNKSLYNVKLKPSYGYYWDRWYQDHMVIIGKRKNKILIETGNIEKI